MNLAVGILLLRASFGRKLGLWPDDGRPSGFCLKEKPGDLTVIDGTDIEVIARMATGKLLERVDGLQPGCPRTFFRATRQRVFSAAVPMEIRIHSGS
jgi:hypothetical protein